MPTISMDIHRPVEAVVGFLLIALPFIADLRPAATVLSVLLGAIVIAVAYGGWRDGDPLGPALHPAVDRFVAAGIGFAALLALAVGQYAGSAVLAVAALVMLGLTLTTRYRAAPPERATTVTWDQRREGSARG